MSINKTFKVLSDPIRRDILELLKSGKLTAGEISENFDLTNATISYHLKLLKEADLIYEEKYKNYIYYGINTSVLDEVLLFVTNLKEKNENE